MLKEHHSPNLTRSCWFLPTSPALIDSVRLSSRSASELTVPCRYPYLSFHCALLPSDHTVMAVAVPATFCKAGEGVLYERVIEHPGSAHFRAPGQKAAENSTN